MSGNRQGRVFDPGSDHPDLMRPLNPNPSGSVHINPLHLREEETPLQRPRPPEQQQQQQKQQEHISYRQQTRR